MNITKFKKELLKMKANELNNFFTEVFSFMTKENKDQYVKEFSSIIELNVLSIVEHEAYREGFEEGYHEGYHEGQNY